MRDDDHVVGADRNIELDRLHPESGRAGEAFERILRIKTAGAAMANDQRSIAEIEHQPAGRGPAARKSRRIAQWVGP